MERKDDKNGYKEYSSIRYRNYGHGIALFSAKAGLNVVMYGRSDASLERGFNSIKASFKSFES